MQKLLEIIAWVNLMIEGNPHSPDETTVRALPRPPRPRPLSHCRNSRVVSGRKNWAHPFPSTLPRPVVPRNRCNHLRHAPREYRFARKIRVPFRAGRSYRKDIPLFAPRRHLPLGFPVKPAAFMRKTGLIERRKGTSSSALV